MQHVHDTFYVLDDGTKADPNDVAVDDKGVLRHANGLAVAMRGAVPRTSGAGPANARMLEPQKTSDMKPAGAGRGGYRTRGAGQG